MKTSTILRRARALIEDPERWCQYGYRDGNKRCALAALGVRFVKKSGISIVPARSRDAYDSLVQASGYEFGTEYISQVNDNSGHAAVMDLYDIAISAAMSDEEAR